VEEGIIETGKGVGADEVVRSMACSERERRGRSKSHRSYDNNTSTAHTEKATLCLLHRERRGKAERRRARIQRDAAREIEGIPPHPFSPSPLPFSSEPSPRTANRTKLAPLSRGGEQAGSEDYGYYGTEEGDPSEGGVGVGTAAAKLEAQVKMRLQTVRGWTFL
jgi:hypothetical protein